MQVIVKWSIIFYDMLHPYEPRCLAETQFTNKRICIFTKHKRYSKKTVIFTLYHEVIHIAFRFFFKESLFNDYLDKVLDLTDYNLGKRINSKKIVREKGWAYYKNTYHPWTLKKRWNSNA